MRRIQGLVLVAAAALVGGPARGLPSARAEGADDAVSSVAAVNGVVVHGVDRKTLAGFARDADRRLADGDAAAAAAALAEMTGADLSPLLEEEAGTWLAARESMLQRVAALPPDGLAAYRRSVDPRAAAALADALRRRDVAALARDASRYAFATDGPRLLLLLADLSLARGDASLAERALEDLIRLLPDHAPATTLAAAASRLTALLAARGDASALRALPRDVPAAALDLPSPVVEGAKLRDEIARAAERAARTESLPVGPDGPMRVVAELTSDRNARRPGPAGRFPGTLREHPISIGTPDRPAIVIRAQSASRSAAVVAGLETVVAQSPSGDPVRQFRMMWRWPSFVSEEPRPAVAYPFAPARLRDDLIVFTWPAPLADVSPDDRFAMEGRERHELVVLSLPAEGKLVDERGRDESSRPDADAELMSMSFCGRPCIDGTAVYATAVRPAERSGSTELHLCRFDFVPSPTGGELRLRWRRHVLDGPELPVARFKASESGGSAWGDLSSLLALPTSPLLRAGRVFVGSNSGAVACLDAGTGRPEWVETYDRAGPSSRITVRESELATWDDVPLAVDGPYVFAAPRDAESFIQFRRVPRRAKSLRVEDYVFAGVGGTAARAGTPLVDLVPTQCGGVIDGIVYLAGAVRRRELAAQSPSASPFVAFDLASRSTRVAEIQEYAASGPPVPVRGGLLFPTPKAIYLVRGAAFEAPPTVLWRSAGGGDPSRSPDQIGALVPDGRHLWSVTPSRVLLLEPAQ